MTQPTQQVPGLYRRRIGDVVVTVINDGSLVIPVEYFSGATEAEIESAQRAAGRRPPFATAINAFLLQWPDRTVLVDAGAGNAMGPGAGRLMAGLAAAGVAAADIDAVLLTHLHSDHYGGLVDGAGAAVFPRADLVLPEAEMAFWTSDANEAAAPEGKKGGFAASKAVLTAYSGRVRAFTGTDAMPGVTAVPLPGHTPGHTGYALGAGETGLVIFADVFHSPDVQSRHPDVTIGFDNDPAQAIRSRRDILARAADEGFLVAGMHMHFPAFARIARAGDAFAVLPQPWITEL